MTEEMIITGANGEYADPQAGRDRLAAEREEHRARRAAAGLPSTDLDAAAGAGPDWPGRGVTVTTTSDGRMRTTPSPHPNDRITAVLMARAVVDLDEHAAMLAGDVATRDTTIRELRERGERYEHRERDLRGKVSAVETLHSEAERITWACSDPCHCTNTVGLGYCRECGELVPCRTIRTLNGDRTVYVKPDEPEIDDDDAPAEAPESAHAPGEGPG